jgi:hypothetical protein
MKPRFYLRSLFGLLTASAVGAWLLRGVFSQPDPYWALYLIGLTSIFSGIAAICLAAFDPQSAKH